MGKMKTFLILILTSIILGIITYLLNLDFSDRAWNFYKSLLESDPTSEEDDDDDYPPKDSW